MASTTITEKVSIPFDPARKSSYYILPVVFDITTHVPWIMGKRVAIPRQGASTEEKKESLIPQFTFEPFTGETSSDQITSKKIDFVDFAIAKIKEDMSPLTTPFVVMNSSRTTFEKPSNPKLPESISGFVGFQAMVHYPLDTNQDPRFCYGWLDWFTAKATYVGNAVQSKLKRLAQVIKTVNDAVKPETEFNNPVLTIIIPLQMKTEDINSLRIGDHPLLFSPLLLPDIVTPIDLADETFLRSFPLSNNVNDLRKFGSDIQSLIEVKRLQRQKWWELKFPPRDAAPDGKRPEAPRPLPGGAKYIPLSSIPINDLERRQIYSLDPFTTSGPSMKVKLGMISFQTWMFFMRKVSFAWRHAYNPESLTWPSGFLTSGGDNADASYDEVLSSIGISSVSEWFRSTQLESVVSEKMKDLYEIIQGYSPPINQLSATTKSNLSRFFLAFMLTGDSPYSDAQVHSMLEDVERRLNFVSSNPREQLINKQVAARRDRMKGLLKVTHVVFSTRPDQLTDDMLRRREDSKSRLFYFLYCFTRFLIANATDEIVLPSFDVFRLVPLAFLSNSKPFKSSDSQPVYYREYSFNTEENVRDFSDWNDEVASIWNALSTADMSGGESLQELLRNGSNRSLGIRAMIQPITEVAIKTIFIAAFLSKPEAILPQTINLSLLGLEAGSLIPTYIFNKFSASIISGTVAFLWYTYQSRKQSAPTGAMSHHYYRLPLTEQEKGPLRSLLNQSPDIVVSRLLEPFGQTLYIAEDAIHNREEYQRFRSSVSSGNPGRFLSEDNEGAWSSPLSNGGRDSLRVVHTWLKSMEEAVIDYYLFNHPSGLVQDIPVGVWIQLQRFSTQQMDVDKIILSNSKNLNAELEAFIQREPSLAERVKIIESVEIDKSAVGALERGIAEYSRIGDLEIRPENYSRFILLKKIQTGGSVGSTRLVTRYEWSEGTKKKMWASRRVDTRPILEEPDMLYFVPSLNSTAKQTANAMLMSLLFTVSHQVQTMDYMDFIKSVISNGLWDAEVERWTVWFITNLHYLGWNGVDGSFYTVLAITMSSFLSIQPVARALRWNISLDVRGASVLESKRGDGYAGTETVEGNVILTSRVTTEAELLEENRFVAARGKTSIYLFYDASNLRHGPFATGLPLQLWQFTNSLIRALNMKLLAPFLPNEVWDITYTVWNSTEFQRFLWTDVDKRIQRFRRDRPWRAQFPLLQRLAVEIKRVFFVSQLGDSYDGNANLHLLQIQDEGKISILSKGDLVTNYRVWADMVGGIMGYCYPEPSADADWYNWNFLILPFEIHTQEIGGEGKVNIPAPAIDMETFVFGHQKYLDTLVFSSPFVSSEQLLRPSTIYTIIPPSPDKVMFRAASSRLRWFPTFPSSLSIAELRMTLMWLQYLSISPTTGQATSKPTRIFSASLRDNIQQKLSEMRTYLLYSKKLAVILIAKRPDNDEQQIQIPNIILGQSRLLHMEQDLFNPNLLNIPFPFFVHPWSRLPGLEALWPLAVSTGVVTFRERFNFFKGAVHHYYESMIFSKIKQNVKDISWWNKSTYVLVIVPWVLYNMYTTFNSSMQSVWLYNLSTNIDSSVQHPSIAIDAPLPLKTEKQLLPAIRESPVSTSVTRRSFRREFDDSSVSQSANELDLQQRSEALFTDTEISPVPNSEKAVVSNETPLSPSQELIPVTQNTLRVWFDTMCKPVTRFFDATLKDASTPWSLGAQFFLNTMAISFLIQESDLFLFRRVNYHEDVPIRHTWWTRNVLGINESELSEPRRQFLQLWRRFFVPGAIAVSHFASVSYMGFSDEFVWAVALTTLQSMLWPRLSSRIFKRRK